jgi:hypothetical protein
LRPGRCGQQPEAYLPGYCFRISVRLDTVSRSLPLALAVVILAAVAPAAPSPSGWQPLTALARHRCCPPGSATQRGDSVPWPCPSR